MSYRDTVNDPSVSVDSDAIAQALAQFAKAQGVVDQAGWNTFVDNLSAANLLVLERARLKKEFVFKP